MLVPMSMFRLCRTLVALVLSVVLALASQDVAMARGSAAGGIVICTGAGLIVVDAGGQDQPSGAPMACPDGILAFALAVGPHAPRRLAGAPQVIASDGPAAAAESVPALHLPPVRGPPARV